MTAGLAAFVLLGLWTGLGPSSVSVESSREVLGGLLQASAAILGLIVVALTFSAERAQSAEDRVREWLQRQERRLASDLPSVIDSYYAYIKQNVRSIEKDSWHIGVANRLGWLLELAVLIAPVSYMAFDKADVICRLRLGREPTDEELEAEVLRLSTEAERARLDLTRRADLAVDVLGVLSELSDGKDPPTEEALREWEMSVDMDLRRLHWAQGLRSGRTRLAILCLALTFSLSAVGLGILGEVTEPVTRFAWVTAAEVLATASVVALVWVLNYILAR